MRLGLSPAPVIPGVSRSPVGVGDVVGSVVVFLLAFWSQRWVLDLPLTAIDTIPTLAAARVESWTGIFDVLLRELRGGVTGGHYYRPLTLVSYTFDQWIWGGSAFGYHLTDIVLHGMATVAVFWMARLAVGLPRLAAIFAASLFLMHPAVIEVVPAVARRQEPLLVIGFCLAVIGARHLPLRVGWLLMLLGTLVSVTSVERGLAVPGVVIGYLFFYRFAGEPFHRRFRGSVGWTLPVAAVALGFFALRTFLHGGGSINPYALGFLRIPFDFGLQLIYPQQLVDVVPPSSPAATTFGLALVALACTAIALPIFRARQRAQVWFALSWAVSYLLLLTVAGLFMPWYIYTAVPPLALVIAFLANESCCLFRRSRVSWPRATLAAGSALALTVALAVPSPTVHSYPGWRVASSLSERFLDQLEWLEEQMPPHSSVAIINLPAHFREAASDYMVTRSAAILWPSSVRVWRQEHFCEIDLTLIGSSDFVAEPSIPHVEFRKDAVQIYFVEGSSRYTNAYRDWPGARPLPESVGRGYEFPWPAEARAPHSTRIFIFDGERLVPFRQPPRFGSLIPPAQQFSGWTPTGSPAPRSDIHHPRRPAGRNPSPSAARG